MALLACVGVDEEGFRGVLAVEVAGTGKGTVYASLLRRLIDGGLNGVRLVVSDDHEGIKAAVLGELPGAEWQRCTVHLERNVLSHVPTTSMGEVTQYLKAILSGARMPLELWSRSSLSSTQCVSRRLSPSSRRV
jgi:transposase-like protein